MDFDHFYVQIDIYWSQIEMVKDQYRFFFFFVFFFLTELWLLTDIKIVKYFQYKLVDFFLSNFTSIYTLVMTRFKFGLKNEQFCKFWQSNDPWLMWKLCFGELSWKWIIWFCWKFYLCIYINKNDRHIAELLLMPNSAMLSCSLCIAFTESMVMHFQSSILLFD